MPMCAGAHGDQRYMWNIFSYCFLFQCFETESLTELKHITQLVGEPRDPPSPSPKLLDASA